MHKKIRSKSIIIVIISFILIIYALNHLNLPLNLHDDLNSHNSNIIDSKYPKTSISNFNLVENYNHLSPLSSVELLGISPAGSVIKTGPYGNKSSPIKIAYVVGVHPQEQNSHQAILNMILKNQGNLRYSYYIYIVGVKPTDDYFKNRYYGQLLAYKYAVSDIKKNKFNLAVDVHSNQGKYQKKTFVFTAIPQGISITTSNFLVKNIPWLSYYVPPRSSEPTSAPYISEPLIKNGIPTIVYETLRDENLNTSEKKAEEFIIVLDSYKF